MAKRIAMFLVLLAITGCSANFYKYPNQIRLAVYDKGCLDVQYAATVDGAPVQFYECGDGKRSQEWQITPAQSTAQVQIMNINSQLCMAVSSDPATGGVNQPAQKVIQEICQPIGTTPSQMWRIVPATDGTPGDQIINAASGQCLDLPYGAIASIFLMQQYMCTPGDPAQGWKITPVQLGNIP
jgi:Ricin-type beta-trefoil lectin domain.